MGVGLEIQGFAFEELGFGVDVQGLGARSAFLGSGVGWFLQK